MASSYVAPGRLGSPNMTVDTDPRIHPRLLAALTSLGLNGRQHSDSIENSIAAIEPLMAASHKGMSAVYASVPLELPSDKDEADVTRTDLSIDGPDGNKIALYVYRRADQPAATSAPIPAVMYTHGGGMTIIDTLSRVHERWCRSLAQRGVAAVLVDFRNAWSAAGGQQQHHHPFPAGLNDCAAAARYVSAHRRELGISKLVLQGESGGGNLALATALKAKREGWAHEIAGVHANIPFISAAYGWAEERRLAELPSLCENDGYMLDATMMAAMASYYTPAPEDLTNPLAWPYHATDADLRGLPPHVLSMDELDPLRDEGMAYYRKLLAAGVQAAADVSLGTVHGAGLIFRQALPETNNRLASQVAAFALRV